MEYFGMNTKRGPKPHLSANSLLQEVQILKSLILGEEERGQSQYQVMCFIFHFTKDSFISSDAMSKLRQKNPSTVRTPEEDLGRLATFKLNCFESLKMKL